MIRAIPRCFRIVDLKINCIYCDGYCVKNGHSKGKQRWLCRSCKRAFTSIYKYNACQPGINRMIISLLKEGCGVRSISRLLQISVVTVLKRLLIISDAVVQPSFCLSSVYEVDELHTYIGDKSRAVWIVYALERNTGSIIGFNIGNRSVKTIVAVIHRLALLSAQCIYRSTFSLPFHRSKEHS